LCKIKGRERKVEQVVGGQSFFLTFGGGPHRGSPPPPPLLRAPYSLSPRSNLTDSADTAPLPQSQPCAGSFSANVRECYCLVAVTATRGSAATTFRLSATVFYEFSRLGGPFRGGRAGGGRIRRFNPSGGSNTR